MNDTSRANRREEESSVKLFPASFGAWAGSDPARSVAVLMSGGVDSSVAALLLKESGWDVLGITMRIPAAPNRDSPTPCCGSEAALVCRQIGISHYFVDVSGAFEKLVIERFRRAYFEGRTPNPCVDCNTLVKFRLVWNFLEKTFGIRHLATGHYARVVRRNGSTYLARALAEDRDQSYFIYGIPSRRLQHLVLPLGAMSKHEVRGRARGAGLPVAEKQDSMELCFASGGDYRRAMNEGIPHHGNIIDAAGNVIGRHAGIHNYTLGQRHGLGVGGGRALYVTRVCPEDNTVSLGSKEEASRARVRARDINVLITEKLVSGAALSGKIRSYGPAFPCRVTTAGKRIFAVDFEKPQFAPSPGQHLVLYDKEGNVVAGGTICPERPIRRSDKVARPAVQLTVCSTLLGTQERGEIR